MKISQYVLPLICAEKKCESVQVTIQKPLFLKGPSSLVANRNHCYDIEYAGIMAV